VDADKGNLSAASLRALAAARAWAGPQGRVEVIAEHPVIDGLAEGIACWHRFVGDPLNVRAALADWVSAWLGEHCGACVFGADYPSVYGEVLRRVAVARQMPVSAGVRRVQDGAITVAADSGQRYFLHTQAAVVLVDRDTPVVTTRRRPVGVEADTTLTTVTLPATDGQVRVCEHRPPVRSEAPLAEAEFVISAGDGVTDFESFRRLGKALGAALGASKVVCDAGNLPREFQVGSSGTIVKPRWYFALGISGSPQHLKGLEGKPEIIAVNTDLHATMVDAATVAVIEDAQSVMLAMLVALEAKERA
jgi:electron transfer flavoprotein alpha subunit